MPRRITAGAWPTARRANTTRRSPTSPRPSGSTRKLPMAYYNRGSAYGERANTTRPLPTTPRPSGSTRNMPRRITTGAMAYANKGEYDKAIADYTEAIRLDPKYAEAYYNRGMAYGNEGRLRQGDCRLHRGHPAQPEIAVAYCNRGTAYGTRASYDKAIADYTEAIRLDPKYAVAYYNRGVAYAARANTTRPLPTSPRPSGSTRSMPWRISDTGRIAYANQGRTYDKAIADYTEAIRLDPKYADGVLQPGRGLRRQRANTTRRSPTSPRPSGWTRRCADAYCNRGVAYAKQGRVRQGHCRLHRGHPARPEICLRILQPGHAYGQKGEYDKAIADLTEAIRLDPKSNMRWRIAARGVAYGHKGEHDKAIADLTEAIRLDPKLAEAYWWRGGAYRQKGEYSKAKPDLDQAERLGFKAQ